MRRGLRAGLPPLAGGAVAALLLAGCAPAEANLPPSERVASAPAPALAPTAQFDVPLSEGAATAERLGVDSGALAARAAALRARGSALSEAGVVDDAARPRLEDARPGAEGASP